MEENYVATLFKKVVVSEEVYIFIPIHVIEGKYRKESNIFVDNLDNLYYDIIGAHVGINNRQEFFGFPAPLEKTQKQFNTENKAVALKEYFEAISSNIYLGTIGKDSSELEIISLPISDIKNISISENKSVSIKQEDDVKFYFEVEDINKMLEMQSLEEIKKYLNGVLINVEKTKSAINFLKEQVSSISTTVNTTIIRPNDNLNILDMYNYITSKVINQDEAVKKVMMTFILNNVAANSGTFTGMFSNHQPTRTFITGSTGTGKTLIIESIIEYLENYTKFNIPMVKVPTSQLTAAGYVGMDLEDVLEELVSKVTITNDISEKIRYAEKNGTIFLDEIDKKGSRNNEDASGRSVLNSLLQFLDGANYLLFSKQRNAMNQNINPSYFNTKNLNIFASGAFTYVKDEVNKNKVGFVTDSKQIIKTLSLADYVEKGYMPSEFMGRFHQMVSLNPLEIDNLKDILNKSIASPILIEQQKLELIGLNLSWDQSFIEEVAKKAYNLKVGARSLKTIIEESLAELKWNALISGKEQTVLVTRETVENPKQYRII